ncbi:head-tail adaptor protein [Kitasatospora sp. MBT63]|uniref:head-tail adaptor protein n=1 Tax=Kitasatospora sp. MBT63 TaxID=1444768 RepID=UPI00053ACDFF|nr:head-tail adaptor protein [Kitasatospora sp. MBT63]
MSGIGHLLNRVLEVWRPAAVPDGAGGQAVALALAGEVRAKVDQPSASDRTLAAQTGSRHTHTVYLLPTADVARGDELRGGGQRLRVHSVVEPSRPDYRKAETELIQPEGAPP